MSGRRVRYLVVRAVLPECRHEEGIGQPIAERTEGLTPE